MNKFDLDYIVSLIEGNIYPTLKRGFGGIERKIRRDKYGRDTPPSQDESSFSLPFSFGGGRSKRSPPRPPLTDSEVNF